MTGSEYLRKAAEVWRGASAEQKQLATEKAKKIKMDPLQNMDSEQAINHHLKIISKSVSCHLFIYYYTPLLF